VDLATIPLHVRAGALLPLGPVKQYSDEPVDAPLSLIIYPGADGKASVYEDDGKTFAYRNGEWMRMEMRWQDKVRRMTLRPAEGSRIRPPNRRPIEVRIAGETAVRTIVFDGCPVELSL
jgi:alpha-glucosidase (family GH31 glycosyl hydrolase)